MLQKALIALAALVAAALMVALAWGVTALFTSGAIHLSKWSAIGIVAAMLIGGHLFRSRRRRQR
ncbi:MAG: hypothetical protein ACJ8EB_00460 [Allosphingosinicella sp.]